jgi:hypothetical protein
VYPVSNFSSFVSYPEAGLVYVILAIFQKK